MAITTSLDKGVFQILLDRPEKRNSLDSQHCIELCAQLKQADEDKNVGAIVLCGLTNVFCPGLDIDEMHSTPQTVISAFDALIEQIDTTQKPIVVAVNGPAVAQGVALLYHCDIVYCGEHALFSLPSLALGLTPRYGVSSLAVKNGGYKLAAQKILLSEPISPSEAVELGIVNHVLPDDKVLGQATASAVRLACMPPIALKETKQLLKNAYFYGIQDAVEQEEAIFPNMLGAKENQEALAAFMENRQPNFER